MTPLGKAITAAAFVFLLVAVNWVFELGAKNPRVFVEECLRSGGVVKLEGDVRDGSIRFDDLECVRCSTLECRELWKDTRRHD